MSYASQAQLANDAAFRNRVSACAAVEIPHTHQPVQWTNDHIWWVSAAPGFADAYEYAVNTGVVNPGGDPAVITDSQILSAVQAIGAEEP